MRAPKSMRESMEHPVVAHRRDWPGPGLVFNPGNRLEVIFERLIQLLEEWKPLVISRFVSLSLAGFFFDFDRGRTSFFDILESTSSDGGQQGNAVSGTLLRINRDHVLSKDIGLQLSPKLAFRAATGHADLSDRHVHRLDDLEAIAHGIGDAFHDRSRQVSALMFQR